MAITFPGEAGAPVKPDLEFIESFDNAQIGGIEKFSTISTGVISIADVMPKAGGTFTGNVTFQSTETQGNNFMTPINSGSGTINWARVSKSGAKLSDISAAQAHIADADGSLGDITTKFNTLLSELEAHYLLAAS